MTRVDFYEIGCDEILDTYTTDCVPAIGDDASIVSHGARVECRVVCRRHVLKNKLWVYDDTVECRVVLAGPVVTQ
jgi:hypothetical protein